MPIDPALIQLGVEAAMAIMRQVALYSRGAAATPEDLATAHTAVIKFMDLVAAEVEKRHSKPWPT